MDNINNINNDIDIDYDVDAMNIYLEETENVEISYVIVDVLDDNIIQNNTQENNIQDMFQNELDIQLNKLIIYGYIPKYLYPNESIKNNIKTYNIDDVYIKLISYHLYRQFIYRKFSERYYKSNYNNFGIYPQSKLRNCIYAIDFYNKE